MSMLPSRPRRGPAIIRIACAILAAGLVTGCVQDELVLTVPGDGTATIAYTFWIPKEFAEVAESARLRAINSTAPGPLFEPGMCNGLTALSALNPQPDFKFRGRESIDGDRYSCRIEFILKDFERMAAAQVVSPVNPFGVKFDPNNRQVSFQFPPRIPEGEDPRSALEQLSRQITLDLPGESSEAALQKIIAQDFRAVISLLEMFGRYSTSTLRVEASEIISSTGTISEDRRSTNLPLDLAATARAQLRLDDTESAQPQKGSGAGGGAQPAGAEGPKTDFIVTFRY